MELIGPNHENNKMYIFINKNEEIVELPTDYIKYIFSKPKYSKKSVHQYAKVLKYFCNYIELILPTYSIDDCLKTIDGQFINIYLTHLLDIEKLEVSTVRNRDSIIKEFMEWLTTDAGGKVRDFSGYTEGEYKSPSPTKKLPKYRTLNEIINFINSLHDESQRCMVHFLFDTGIRVSEVPRILKSDIPDLSQYGDGDVYFPLVIRGSKGSGGNIKMRTTYITRPMIQRINQLHNRNKVYLKAKATYKNDIPCFLNVHGNRLTKNAISNLLRKSSLRAGLDPKMYSSHKYRHSFAVSVLNSEYDKELTNKLVMTREALGHNDIRTTQIYTSIHTGTLNKLRKDNEKIKIVFRFEEAQKILDCTFKPQKHHTERRGRKNKK